MNRIVTLAMVTVFGLSAVQSASAHSGGSNGHGSQHSSTNRYSSDRHDKDHCKNDGPPKYMGGSQNGPAGTPENPFKPTPVTNNGFVFVNGHWERAKAGQATVVDPTLVGPVVRDHRGSQGAGGVTVTNTGGFTGTVRDHRGSGTSGFTGTVRDHRGSGTGSNDVVGVGESPVDSIVSGLSGIGSAIGNGLTGIGNAFGIGQGSITSPGGDSGSRDHRTTDTSNFGSNVRDHR